MHHRQCSMRSSVRSTYSSLTAGQSRQRRHDRGPLLGGQPPAARQRQPVGPGGELLGLGAHLLERPALVEAVVVGDRGVRRQEVQAGLVGAEVLEVLAAEVDDAGHQHQPVERHRVHLREPLGDGDGAGGAVGLADHVLRRHPPVLARAPQPDQLGDLLHVLAEPVVLAGLPALDRAAVAGRHRVDEDEVAHGEQGLGVVDQRVRRRGRRVHAAHVDASRPEQSHVQPDRGRARTTVEDEGDRPLGHVGVVEGVRRHRQLGARLPAGELLLLDLLLAQHDATRAGGVGDLAAGGAQRMVADDQVVDRLLRLRVLGLLLVVAHASPFSCSAPRWPPGTHSTSPPSRFAYLARMKTRSESRLR